jgi:hypothetical protein
LLRALSRRSKVASVGGRVPTKPFRRATKPFSLPAKISGNERRISGPLDQTTRFDHAGNHAQRNLPPISQELPAGNAQVFSRLSAEMTEYEIREIGRHQWLVFADRQSIALCADENEAVKAMTEHSARSRQSGTPLGCYPEQDPPA